MDVIVIFNGLGNQMSQYAFYLAKKKLYSKTTCIYWTRRVNNKVVHNGYELGSVFNVNLPNSKTEKIVRYIFSVLNIETRNIFIRAIRRILVLMHCIGYIYDLTDYYYDPKKMEKGSALINYYVGGWHSYKYSESVKQEFSKVYKFNLEKLTPKTLNISEQIERSDSISIHIRRGDYLDKKNQKLGNVATEKYYKKALDYISTLKINPSFFIFSNDSEWVKENMHLNNMTIINWNIGIDSWNDMYLMSICKININPNSTFSLWAARLNKNENRIVIVPDRFNFDFPNKDFYAEDWKKISV